jgi:hypothetical protein
MVLARHPFFSTIRVPAWGVLDRRTLLAAAAIAALSAAAMFMSFLLAEQTSPTSGVSHQSVTVPPTPKTTPYVNSQKSIIQTPSMPDVKVPAADEIAQIQPLNFTLVRSRKIEKVGPFTVRLVKTDPRRGSCSLAVIDEQGNTRYHRLRTKESIRLSEGEAKGAALTVTRVGKDRIQGVVSQTELTSVVFRSHRSKLVPSVRG